jgi:dTMP kinase
MKKGKLIIIESGADGSGKATQTEKIYEKLKAEGYKVRKVTFPVYDSDSSALVKMYLRGDFGTDPESIDAYVASTFFAVDRYASYKTDWGKFYEDGGIIISDRYTTSNMVHQGAKMESKEELENYLNWLYDLEYNTYKIPKPDAVMFLDVHPEVCQKLRENRENKITGTLEKDIHESDEDYLVKSYENAKYIASKYSWIELKCTRDGDMICIDEIAEELYKKIKEII